METPEDLDEFLNEGWGSYPTYEEWKLSFFLYFYVFQSTVLILPMRNKKQTDAHIARLYN